MKFANTKHDAFSKRRLPKLGVGLGYRAAIHNDIMKSLGSIDWLEIIADQFIPFHGVFRSRLDEFTKTGPCVSHSLELSLGSMLAAPREYIEAVISIAAALDAPWFSDHLAFNRLRSLNTGVFLPPFRNLESVVRIADRIRYLQAAARRPFLIENVAGVIDPGGDLHEVDFINEVAKQADCGILLDLANLLGRCINLRWDIDNYVDRLDLSRVTQVHIAGGRWHDGQLRDTHDQPVSDDVWSLLAIIANRTDLNAVLIERDANFPAHFDTLLDELARARAILADPPPPAERLAIIQVCPTSPTEVRSQQELEDVVQLAVLSADEPVDSPPPDIPLTKDQWRELYKFGLEVFHKRKNVIQTFFPATLGLFAATTLEPAPLLSNFAKKYPRMKSLEDEFGFRSAEILRFSQFAMKTAGLSPFPSAVVALAQYEAALGMIATSDVNHELPISCPTGECVVGEDFLDLCCDAVLMLAKAARFLRTDFNVVAVRAALVRDWQAHSKEISRLLLAHSAATDILVAPGAAGYPRVFRLRRREARCLQSILQCAYGAGQMARKIFNDVYAKNLILTALRANALVIIHPGSTGREI